MTEFLCVFTHFLRESGSIDIRFILPGNGIFCLS